MAKDKVIVEIVAKDKTKKGVDSATKSFAKMAKTIGPLVAAGFGIAAVKAVTDAYIRQEDAIAQLDARLKSTGNQVGLTSKQLQGLASSLQGVTRFGDEAIIEMQSLLLTFTKIGGDTFPQATEAILNVSTAMGQDLQSAAIQVGKALNDPILGVTALQRSGIQFTESQKDTIKSLVEMGDTVGAQTIILKELEVQFGGAARAAKDTLGGAMQTAKNDVGDLAESIGGILAPTIGELADLASFAARALREMIDPTLQGDLEEINAEIEAMGGLLNDMAAEGTAQNQLDFVENQIDDLVSKRIELETKIQEINNPIAQQGAATGTAGVPGSAADAASGLPPSIASFREIDAARLAEVDAQILMQQIAQGELLTDTWLKVARDKEGIDQRSADAKQQLLELELQREEAKNKALGDLASLMNSKNREAFEVGKVAAIAQTTISTYESATASYKALSGIPYVGPALGVAAAAAAVAAGLSNVQKISSTKFGGGGPTGAATPNITTGGAVIGPVIQPAGQTSAQIGGQPIVVEGNSLLAVMVEEQLIPAMNEAISRGVQLVIV